MLQRTHDLLDCLGGDPSVERCAVQLGMTEQNLNHTHIDVLFQEMGGKTVPQRVQRHFLLDAGSLSGSMTSAIELARGDRLRPDRGLETTSLEAAPPATRSEAGRADAARA